MGEQGYKVGDWVRVKDNRGAPRDYKVGDVCQVTKIEDDIVRCGEAGMFDYRFEPWQPRVGERVRVVRAELSQKSSCIGREFAVTKEAYKVGNGVQTWGGDYAGGYVWRADELEPILSTATPEQPTTLKIEAGKFYKTRDGRKVGPMASAGSKIYGAEGRQWQCNGSYWNGVGGKEQNDLIAEWIDEPVAKPKPSNDNAQPKFKVGDRVTAKHDSQLGMISKGDLGTVKSVGGGHLRVNFDNGREDGWQVENFDLVTSPTTATIVALIENGQPKPSSTPHVHTSTGAAEKEAKRLAAKYKGQQFGVFTLTTTHEEAAPVYGHKWQNLAALGLKIDAIKELRGITGMGLKPAKDAVEYFLDAA
ncbi:hypothetical protein [Agrobacterium rosae]|uniref:Uncharacterized protein n=1 Tax=Agrobacterium rosae TaxID=1972867 RepID=A0AAW9FJL7_9HYPH|nr:hypothetical protein [Agrobacterium rosae]MDX8305614.1 hypothetical protein [Agrobacterium rosae]